MDAYDARNRYYKIHTNPSLDDLSGEYSNLLTLADEVIDALNECETARDEANDRIAELERQIEELSDKENS